MLFFDAGNTLVFPDRDRTFAPLAARGITVTESQIYAAERAGRQFRDSVPPEQLSRDIDREYWAFHFRSLLGPDADPQLVTELFESSHHAANWTRVLPGTREALLNLKNDYRLAVISNSDGTMANLIASVGLGDCFEFVIDSSKVGYQKPHPEIFRTALKTANVEPHESVYIGDIYSIDYTGSTAVGMHAILMDPYGTYSSNGLPRVTQLSDLRPLLSKM